MLMSAKRYLELFEGATPDEKSELIDDMSIEEAELLHDNGYNVYLYDGEVSKVEKRDTKESWYCSNYDPAWENNN
jgi:hypothetical protein